MTVHAVIAVRGGEDAKSRCGAVLRASERQGLVSAMLADMIEVLNASQSIDLTHVVTPTSMLAEVAREAGARAILEGKPRGVNNAFETARRVIRDAGPQAVMVALPGDLPLLEGVEIERAVGLLKPGVVIVVPASADGGTGAVIIHADAQFAFSFGPNSFRRHCAGAWAAGLRPIVYLAAGLGLDVDRPEDCHQVLRHKFKGRTGELLLHCLRPQEASQ